jgi:hypothetical protein
MANMATHDPPEQAPSTGDAHKSIERKKRKVASCDDVAKEDPDKEERRRQKIKRKEEAEKAARKLKPKRHKEKNKTIRKDGNGEDLAKANADEAILLSASQEEGSVELVSTTPDAMPLVKRKKKTKRNKVVSLENELDDRDFRRG